MTRDELIFLAAAAIYASLPGNNPGDNRREAVAQATKLYDDYEERERRVAEGIRLRER